MSTQKYPQSTKTSTEGGTARKGREHYSHAKADARVEQRRKEADLRQGKYNALTLKEKLANSISGGSKRERARIEKLMAAAK